MKNPKKQVAVLLAFAFVISLAAYTGFNATAGEPGSPLIPGPPQTSEESGPVESEPVDAQPWPPQNCYWVCDCEFDPPLPPTCYCYLVCE